MSTTKGRGDFKTTGDDIVLKEGETDEVTISAGDNAAAATHKTPDNSSVLIGAEHGGDATKKVAVDTSGATTSTKTTIAASQTTDRTLTLPDATDTLVGRATTDTLTNKTITALQITAGSTIDTNSSGTLGIGGTNATTITIGRSGQTVTIAGDLNVSGNLDVNEVQDDTFTIVDEGDETKALNFSLGGATTSTTTTLVSSQTSSRSVTLPDATTTLVGQDTTDTLTNKTLTSPKITDAGAGDLVITSSDGTLSTDRTLSIDVTDGDRSIDLAGNLVVEATSTLNQDLTTDASPTFAAVQLNDNTTGTYDLILDSDSDGTALTADRTLTFDVNNADRTVDLAGNLTVESASTLNQDLTSDAQPTFAGVKTSGAIDFDQISTPSNPSAGDNKLYFKNDDKLYKLNSSGEEVEVGSGAGGGGVNYVTNGDFNVNIDSWTLTTGTGTLSQETSSPLEGDGSLKYVSDGSTATIDGDLDSIDTIDVGILLGVEMVIEVTDASGSYAEGDFTVEIYDSTNTATKTGPVDLKAGTNRITTNELGFVAEASTTYKVRIKDVSANASPSADYFILDRVKVTPDRSPAGAVITPWTTTTVPWASGSAGTTTFDKFSWRRVGSDMQIQLHYQQTAAGTGGSGDLQITLPNSLSVASDVMPVYDGSPSATQDEMLHVAFGSYITNTTGTAGSTNCYIFARSSTTIGFATIDGSNDMNQLLANVLGNANPTLNGSCFIPIAEWQGAGTVNLLDRGITTSNARVRYYLAGAQSPAADTAIDFDTESTLLEKVGNWSLSSGEITVPSAGTYIVSTRFSFGSASLAGVGYLAINGTREINFNTFDTSAPGNYGIGTATVTIDDPATQTLSIRATQALTTVTVGDGFTWVEVTRVADHSAVAPVGFGTSDEADSSQKYLLPLIRKQTIAADNEFTAGSVLVHYMAGNVTITLKDANWTGAQDIVESSSGLIPSWARPDADVYVTNGDNSGSFVRFRCESDGTISLSFANEALSALNSESSFTRTFTMSFNVD